MSILYITQNGITDHIGRSQVAPYVLGLAAQGYKIHVLSAEKNLAGELVGYYRKLFDQAGIQWTVVPYKNKPPIIGQFATQTKMYSLAEDIVRNEGVRVVHCRSFPPALLGRKLKRNLGVKYIFDFRDFYADGGLVKTKGLRRLIFRYLKFLEGALLRDAAKIVCLTERARDTLLSWYFDADPSAANRFHVIPCCADFDHFDPAHVDSRQLEAARRLAGFPGDAMVMLYLGSLGPDYLLPQMIRLFTRWLARQPNAYFLFVSNNGKELVEEECLRQGIPLERIAFVSAAREQIPSLIGLARFSVVFIRADVSKIGCSPTKLAELFSCNVPVVANSGFGDIDTLLSPKLNDSVVIPDFSDKSMDYALDVIDEVFRSGKKDIRERSRHFALEAGVRRYAEVYEELLKN